MYVCSANGVEGVFSLSVIEGVCFSLIMQYTAVQYFSSVAYIFIGSWGGDPTSVMIIVI